MRQIDNKLFSVAFNKKNEDSFAVREVCMLVCEKIHF